MKQIFVIGDREKNEWVSVFNSEDKQMAFCNELTQAKAYESPEVAFDCLRQMQITPLRSLSLTQQATRSVKMNTSCLSTRASTYVTRLLSSPAVAAAQHCCCSCSSFSREEKRMTKIRQPDH